MKTIRKILLLVLILLTILCMAAFQNADEDIMITRDQETNEDIMITRDQEGAEDDTITRDHDTEEASGEINPITGLPLTNPSLLNLPPVFVPLARYPSAYRPSSGHSLAQWVFEMYVDNEESRPMLMFYGELPIAPISHISSGIFGLEQLRKQYGGIIIMGGTSKSILESDIRSYELWYGLSGDQLYPELPVSEYQRILNKWVPLSTPADPNNLKYEFDANPPEGGRTANSLFVRYASTNQILWEYDPSSGKYMRGQNSVEDPETIVADVDASTGDQIGVENLIVLMAHHDWVPGFKTEYGVFDVNINYVESNPALLFRDGKMYNITWTTKSETFEQESARMRPIRFLDKNGNSFRLKPGQTWIHIVMPGNPYYEVDDELGSTITAGSGFWKLPYISFKPESQAQVEKEVAELSQLEYRLNGAQ